MSQPYPPGPNGQGPHQPYADQYEVSYPPQTGHPQQSQGYGPPPAGQHPQPGPQRSKAPIWIAAGLVLALAIGLTVYFLVRGGSGGEKKGETEAAPTPEEITKTFFTAVDAKDEQGMKDAARGDVEGDIDEIMDGGAETLGVEFAKGKSTDDAAKKTDGVDLAVVVWELEDIPDDLDPGEVSLGVGLLDDGDGYQVCKIDETDGASAKDILQEFEDEYEEVCDYSK